MSAKTCESCKWWKYIASYANTDGRFGECRRFPPHHPTMNDPGFRFTETLSYYFCGEHAPKTSVREME